MFRLFKREMVLWLEQTSCESSWFEYRVVNGPESKKASFFMYKFG